MNLGLCINNTTQRESCAICGDEHRDAIVPTWIFRDADYYQSVCYECAKKHAPQLLEVVELCSKELDTRFPELVIMKCNTRVLEECPICRTEHRDTELPLWIFRDADEGKPVCYGCAKTYAPELLKAIELNLKHDVMKGAVTAQKPLTESNSISKSDNHFGVCPKCHKNNGHLNIERTHWFVCHNCKTKWNVGSNLFSAWKHEDESIWMENAKRIADYEEVEPYHEKVENNLDGKNLKVPDADNWKDQIDTAFKKIQERISKISSEDWTRFCRDLNPICADIRSIWRAIDEFNRYQKTRQVEATAKFMINQGFEFNSVSVDGVSIAVHEGKLVELGPDNDGIPF